MHPVRNSISISLSISRDAAGFYLYGGMEMGLVPGRSRISWTSSIPRSGLYPDGNSTGQTSAYDRNNAAKVSCSVLFTNRSKCLAEPSGKPWPFASKLKMYSKGVPTLTKSYNTASINNSPSATSYCRQTVLTTQLSLFCIQRSTAENNSVGTTNRLKQNIVSFILSSSFNCFKSVTTILLPPSN